MSPEAFTIIGTGIALAALNVGLIAWLRSDVRRLETDVKAGQSRLETDVKAGQSRLEERQIGQGGRLARLEGKIDRFDPPRPHEHAPAPAGD